MSSPEWIAISQVIYNFVASIAALGTVSAAIYAVVVYKHNSRLERARWASSLYEKFYEREQLKKVRDALDCESNMEQVNELVLRGQADFTDYLNFFEFVAFLEYSKQIKRTDVKDMFGYYLDCLRRHSRVRKYVEDNGYERLSKLLENWK